MNLVICKTFEEASDRAAEHVARSLAERAAISPRITMVLSGSGTPRRLYARLASGPFRELIPWQRLHLFWGDERCVPPDDPASNYRMAQETLISRVPIPSENVHRIPAELSEPGRAADLYEAELRKFWNGTPGDWPRFDLVLLGIGADGHIASLFPGSPALDETTRWVAAPYVDRLNSHRLTLTLPVFNHGGQVCFLAAGREKAPIIKAVAAGDGGASPLPAQLIRPVSGRVVFFLDADAAALLEQGNVPSTPSA
ncbi:MAG TPA: 6-phosphogluconolactonase [Nitrospiria bacterium]|nr:6-phosphogluconolactonase [Nitrospiria bacterium]